MARCGCGRPECADYSPEPKIIPLPTTLRAGSVVALKSGGPAMTVSKLKHLPRDEVAVALCWFDPQGILCSTVMPLSCIEVLPPEDETEL